MKRSLQLLGVSTLLLTLIFAWSPTPRAGASPGSIPSNILLDTATVGTGDTNLGNFVWFDSNDNGLVDGQEANYGINGVTVELMSGGAVITSTTTSGGFYEFRELADGDYQVRVAASNFGSGLPLQDYTSSSTDGGDPDNNIENDDNGSGSASGAVTSDPITLAAGTEPLNDDTNLTVDFGFTAPVCGGADDLGGTVFNDYDFDGVRDSLELGFAIGDDGTPIVVNAYDDSNSLVASAQVRPDGSYLFSNYFASSGPARVEFVNLPSYLQVSQVAGGNATETQFHATGTCSADLALQDPATFCGSDPLLFATCFTQAFDPNPPVDAIVSHNYTDEGTGIPHNLEGTTPQVGSVAGLQYQGDTGFLYSAAYLKRHVEMGPDGIGAIYVTDPAGGIPTLFADLNNITLPGGGALPANPAGTDPRTPTTDYYYDPDAFELVGKSGLGDIELSTDQQTLYVVNMHDGQLYQLNADPTNVPQTELAAAPIDIPDNCANTNDARPMGLKFYRGYLYVGVACSAESTAIADTDGIHPDGDVTQLKAEMWRYNPLTNSFDGSPAISVPLDYDRGCVWSGAPDAQTEAFTCSLNNYWRPWQPDPEIIFNRTAPGNAQNNDFYTEYSQPMFSDIEFDDDGNLIIALRDLNGDRTGYCAGSTDTSVPKVGSCNTPPTSSGVHNGNGMGEMIRACGNPLTGWTLESNATCGGITTTGDNNQQGLDGGQYYWNDQGPGGIIGSPGQGHHNTIMGTVVQKPGENSIIASQINAVNTVYSGGVGHYDHTTGNNIQRLEIYPRDATPDGSASLGKANGLGFLDLGCQAAPVQIGNYVWLDSNNNGVQDPSELGISGVRVDLFEDPDGVPNNGDEILVGSTYTSSDGEYFFDVDTHTDYMVAINSADSKLTNYALTQNDYGTNGGNTDVSDSDGITSGDLYIIPLTSGGPGENDYTFDFGFTPDLGAIGNYVWHDENSDGYQDAGESGIPNVTVVLYDATNTPILTTTTDADGGYLFDDLPPGNYTVDIVDASIPTGMTQTDTSLPSGIGVNEDLGNQDHSGNGYPVTIGGSEPLVNLTADFGYNYNPDTDVNGNTGTGAIGDTIWIDSDGDGVQDPSEIGVEGVEVTLYDASGAAIATTTTDANGNYIFDGLAAGQYSVAVTDSSSASHDILGGDYNQTGDPDHFGTGGGTNDNIGDPIVLAPGDVFLNMDFGYQPTAAAPLGSIGDTVYFDADMDGSGPSLAPVDGGAAITQGAAGSADSTDYGIPGVTVSLIADTNGNGVHDAGEPIIATATTDANGQYLFEDLPLNEDYIVWVNDTDNKLAGLTQSYDNDGVLASPNQSAVRITTSAPDDRDQDFGYGPTGNIGSIGDTIWYDVDNSGGAQTSQGAEPGLGNVTVNLYTDSDGDGTPDTLVATTTTDANGNYLFDGLPLDQYFVEVDTSTLPANVGSTPTFDVDGGADSESTVTLTSAMPHDRDQDFSYPPANAALGSIGDTIFGDVDGTEADGVPDAGDIPLAGVRVTLVDSSGNTWETTTDSNGNYLFPDLPADTYTVTVDITTLPDGFSAVPTYEADGGNDSSSSVTLSAGQNVRDQDFSYPLTGEDYSIGDKIWFDVDDSGGDESTQGSEPGLSNVLVKLYDSGGNLVSSTRTDADGYYLFTGLITDTYTVEVDTGTLPAYVDSTSTHDGSDGGSDSTSTIAVSAANPHNRTQDFSYPPSAATGMIGDTIFLDYDSSGSPDNGEGLAGVTVTLTDPSGNVITTTTGPDGRYLFTNLDPTGTYTVSVITSTLPAGVSNTVDPNGGLNSQSVVDLGVSGGIDLDQDFGYEPDTPGSIGNRVWLDTNADGIYDGPNGPDGSAATLDDAEPGIEGVTVDLYLDSNGDGKIDPGEPKIATQTTDANGLYLFDNLPLGDYVVAVSDEDNVLEGYWHSLSANQDVSTNGADDPKDNSKTDPVAVTIGGAEPVDNRNVDFGYYIEPAAVGNYVWLDTDGNGLQDDGETGINGVTVTLQIDYPDDTTLTLKTVTANDSNGNPGYYSFENLLYDEDYRVSGDGTTAPQFTISVDTMQPAVANYEPTMVDVSSATNDLNDSDDHTGVVADLTQGLTDTSAVDPTTTEAAIASYDFGFFIPVEIGNRVWIENDSDGDATTGTVTPVVGAIVTATATDGTVFTATTDAAGLYTITVPATATYTVTVGTPVGTVPSGNLITSDGDPNTDENLSHDGAGTTVTVGVEDNYTIDFGFYKEVEIGNRVWIENDDDGDATTGTTTPVPNAVVTATGSDGTIYTATTDANGLYTITVPANAVYTVTVATPAGTVPSGNIENSDNTPAIGDDENHDGAGTVVTVDETNNYTIDFGFHKQVEIGNRVWIENDDDGDATTGTVTPVPNVVVSAESSNGTIYTATTDANGLYTITVPANAVYTVTVATPAGTVPSGNIENSDNTPAMGDDENHDGAGTVVTVDETNNYTIDFGFHKQVEIGNRVWIENDSDGDATTGTITPVPNALVTATAADGSTYTATTDANGLYTITVPANAVYTVTVATPAGTVPSGNIENTDNTPGMGDDENHDGVGTVVTVDEIDNYTIDFGFHKQVEIGNRVWIENDDDGDATTGTITPVPNALVTATGANGQTYTATTDANGLYTITVPANAVYTVTVATPAGTVPSGNVENTDNTPAMGDDKNHDGTGTVVTVDEINNYTIDFGFHKEVEIGNRVWIENDDDGDATTGTITPVPNVVVSAESSNGTIYTATTDANGLYTITVPANAVYTVTVATPAGTVPSGNIENTDNTPAMGDDENHDGAGTVVTVDETNNYTIDFGFHREVMIGNRVWIENDSDGDATTGIATPVPNVVVLAEAADGTIYTATTDANGLYTITVPANAAYTVTVATPAGTVPSGNISAMDNTPAAGDDTNHDGSGTLVTVDTVDNFTIDFGFYEPVEIGNRVWTENDGNGTADDSGDATAPVVGALVTATGADSTAYTATTDAGGLYTITVPANATYTVTVAAPAGYVPSTLLFGGTDNSPGGNNDENHDHTGAVVDVDTVNNYTIDFGFYQAVQIGNRVWIENDSDGDATTGIVTPVPNVVVSAEAADGTIYTATTDANGLYTITVPADAVYTVTVATPAGTVPSGTLIDTDNDPNADDDQSHDGAGTLVTVGTADNLTIDFGFHKEVEIGNRIWIENDDDGDATTGTITPVPNALVTATGANGQTYTATTDANGLYTITVPANAVYTVTVATPAGTVPSGNIENTDNTPGMGNDENHDGAGTVVTVDETNNYTIDFGFHKEVEIGNRVWIENDDDGDATTGTITPVPNVIVSAESSNGTIYSATTDANGLYTITVPANAVYTVTVATPAGTVPSGNIENTDNTPGMGNDENHDGAGTVVTVDETNNYTIDFGFHREVMLGNRVWIENDSDGDATTGTVAPVVGVVVTATAADGSVYTTTTDSNGLYTITVPADAVYTVTVATPAGAVPSGNIENTDNTSGAGDDLNHDGTGTVVTVDTTDNFTIDFGFYEPVELGNRVWTENDANGVADDSGDGTAPVVGTVVTATAADGTIYTATTDAGGLYTITVPANATYTVTVATPANYVPSALVFGGTDSSPSANNDENHDHTGAVVEMGDANNYTIDFGFTPKLVEIGNYIWLEDDGNGDASDGNPMPATGIVVTATAADGTVYTATTDAAGLYTITVPANATYTVTVAPPDGYVPSTVDPAGADNMNSGSGVAVVVGEANDYTVDFGFTRKMVEIGNRVWIEMDGDGVADNDGSDTPVVGVVVTAVDGAGNSYTATTDANGLYTITVPANDTYTVTVATPVDHNPSTVIVSGTDSDGGTNNNDNHDNSGAVVEVEEENNYTIDFGFTPITVEIGNQVWIESDNNGDVSDGFVRPVSNTVVTAVDAVGNTYTATTDANGFYTITVPVNTVYTVTVGIPAGTVVAGTPAGDNSSSADGMSHNPNGTTVTVGTDNDYTIDFGFYEAPMLYSIGNLIWIDEETSGASAAPNGIFNPGVDTPAQGVTVTLYRVVGGVIETTPFLTQTTTVSGTYQFVNLPAGDYQVVLPPSNFAANGPLWDATKSTAYTVSPNSASDANDEDENHNGSTNLGLGVVSNVVTLGGTMPTGEGGHGLPVVNGDANTDWTVDFAFYLSDTTAVGLRAIGAGASGMMPWVVVSAAVLVAVTTMALGRFWRRNAIIQ